MKRITLNATCAMLAACTTNSYPTANYFGNTLYVMPDNGQGVHYVYYNPDNSFEVYFPKYHYRGTYEIKGHQVCLTAKRPNDVNQSTRCHEFDASRKAGESWTENSTAGIVHFRLDAGRSNGSDNRSLNRNDSATP